MADCRTCCRNFPRRCRIRECRPPRRYRAERSDRSDERGSSSGALLRVADREWLLDDSSPAPERRSACRTRRHEKAARKVAVEIGAFQTIPALRCGIGALRQPHSLSGRQEDRIASTAKLEQEETIEHDQQTYLRGHGGNRARPRRCRPRLRAILYKQAD